jgi:hypothetical protein
MLLKESATKKVSFWSDEVWLPSCSKRMSKASRSMDTFFRKKSIKKKPPPGKEP